MARPAIPVAVETLRPLHAYPLEQLARAVLIHHALDRGRLILCEPPWTA